MPAEQIEPSYLSLLVGRVLKRLQGVKPPDQTKEDMKQSASLYILEKWAAGERRESWLVMYAWGKIKDSSALGFAHASRTREESVYLANVRAGRRSDEPETTLRGGYGRTALFAPNPLERTAPSEQQDARIDIDTALQQLTTTQRAMFTECVINGRTQAAVAAERGVSPDSIYRVLVRAKTRLRAILGDYNDAAGP